MPNRRILLYFSWSRPGEISAPLTTIDDRFPGIFELRRLAYPKFEHLADSRDFDQGIAGFLDHVQKPNFTEFAQQSETLTGIPVKLIERVSGNKKYTALNDNLVSRFDTIVVISFDSFRTAQMPTPEEVATIEDFLATPDHVLFICPHHDIGEAEGLCGQAREDRQIAEHLHHGDPGIPPRQGFGGFARVLLRELGVPVENRFGLRPAAAGDGTPMPADIDRTVDTMGLLNGVVSFNLHAHLPHLERIGAALEGMDVLARQPIDIAAPPHPFTRDGRSTFDALLQSSPGTFAGKLFVCDTTLFSSTAGGINDLRRLWSNLVLRPSP
ncbi:hypothetical protein EDF56_11660 [Novosphingobium sp. PhB165]|uniref:hypothetical protein n=1 Tax=Novosphingobium sp. PhB165 TaxID=2485105 RepID=UPI001042CD5B|nr:hypothetical protein [Novosphingobium sp. PhB165]TCM13036.1 hypothetical protein EDF56_11660 [Novosphingobium sp. PhB165]